jgi:hypothetical protein
MKFSYKKSILGLLVFILSCSISDSENDYTKFSFVKSTNKPTTFKSKKRIAIQTFIDEREKDNISYFGLLLIPLVPYANEDFNKPEMAGQFGIIFLPETDLANAMVTELTDYSVFEKVFYTDRTFPKDADYLIRVRIKKNQIYNKETLYGINTLAGQYFSVLWVLLSTDFYRIKLDVELELLDLKTNQITFKKNFEKEESGSEWGTKKKQFIGEEFFSINKMMIRTMSKEIIQQIAGNEK